MKGSKKIKLFDEPNSRGLSKFSFKRSLFSSLASNRLDYVFSARVPIIRRPSEKLTDPHTRIDRITIYARPITFAVYTIRLARAISGWFCVSGQG